MNYALIINLLSVILPAFVALSGSLVKGKRKYLIAIAAYFILRKWAEAAAESKANSGIGGNTGGYLNANALATSFKNAINPSGWEWAIDSDGTNEELIFGLAAQSRGQMYKAVYNQYNTLYKRDLTKDLQAELSDSDYNKFLQILNS
ncbi:hypothetical protein [Dyadobacter psychrotolerans]|uniref:Uncharacterized protein n=1 Tax=Dyadobacter psychrotolerans TaxID=2541721 RepID=A0A4R5DW91_9BACT|nr:hypothetical protein [Dyadobacter psychrotolerans]TDE15293.1 hypothetical protein E0F88_12275 [Dyadobacter psychrotolerans]